MRTSRKVTILLLLASLLLGGCTRVHKNGVPTSAKEPISRPARIDAALSAAAEFLLARQATDGAWRSDVYGPFKKGDALTALMATALLETCPYSNADRPKAAVGKATEYLTAMVGADGAILPPEFGLAYPIYTAAGAVMVLSRQNDPRLRAARDAWLAYIFKRQLTEALGWFPDVARYGGWGYAAELPTKPAPGEPLGDLAEPNLSATVFALSALRAAGVGTDAPAVQKAFAFVCRCQNITDAPHTRDARFDDGGFHFVDADPVRNKAGVAGVDQAGRTRLVSYGSATADGVRALMLCGAGSDDPRVVAAWHWLARHFVADSHPGAYAPDREGARLAVYYYYCHSLVEALATAGSCSPIVESERTAWAGAIADALVARQRADGSWQNSAVDVREDDPLVATALAASALAGCRRMLSSGGD